MKNLMTEISMQYNIATALLEKKKFTKAISEYKKLLKVYPCKEGYLNLGNCYRQNRDDTSAYANFVLAADEKVPFLNGKEGKYSLALNNMGLYQYSLGNQNNAIRLYKEALELDPKYADARWNLASALLKEACSGNSLVEREGLDAYEARFVKSPPVNLHVDTEGLKMWHGQKVRKLIILAEQGIGDQFMWARYLPLAEKMCEELWVQADPILQDIFKLVGVRTCFRVSEVGEIGEKDAGIPICSLSRAFGIIPDGGNWLEGKVGKRALSSEDFNIGIVWAGSATHANDHNRSVPEHRFHRLAKHAKLWSLKPGFKSTKYINALKIDNWMDTLEWINSMDLIITVDTSVAHAAGCLGVATWMLQPAKETDFRWGTDKFGSKNIWYPSVLVYRNPNDWSFVFDQVEEDLKDLCCV